VIPESDDLNSVARKELISYAIAPLTAPIIVSATIDFDGEFRGEAIEIQNVGAKRVLPTKFETREISIAQVPPKNAFPFGRVLAQVMSMTHKTFNYLAFFRKGVSAPHLNPLPTIGERRERRAANSVTCHHARFAVPLLAFQISEDREKRKAVPITALARRMGLVVRLFLSQRDMMKERDCFP